MHHPSTDLKKLYLKSILTFILFFYFSITKGQVYIFSSMGNFLNTSSNASAVNYTSKASCINLQSGIALLKMSPNTGEFAVNCTIDQKINTLGLQFYPNPVRFISKLKFTHTPPLHEIFTISIWNPEGYIIKTKQVTGYQIFQGLPLNVAELSAGNYILKVESLQFIESIKFIKVN
jgi:hypothetical protein